MSENIEIKGARVNNLKNVDVVLPRNQFIVITGLSGSGKSSLAFDTLYAEGQRRYVESLSAYARQFLGKMSKPEVDYIKGLPPAIAIEQKVNTRNPRSTVGTSTEIYDYLRLLYSRVGHTFSPVTGIEVKKHTIEDVLQKAMQYPVGTKIALCTDVTIPEGRDLKLQAEVYLKAGFSRFLTADNRFVAIEDVAKTESDVTGYKLLIDRLAVSDEKDEVSRLADSIETAFYEGGDALTLVVWAENGAERFEFSRRFEADGIKFLEPDEHLFNFNNPYGACTKCDGFGQILGIDEHLVIPNPALTIFEDAVACWKGEKMSEWKRMLIEMSGELRFPIHKPYCDLTAEEKNVLWHGKGGFPGIDGFFKMVNQNAYKVQYTILRNRFRGKTLCPECKGDRLRPEAMYVKVAGKTICELTKMSVADLAVWFDNLVLSKTEESIAKRILFEIKSRLTYLIEVGLGYLTLNRASATLSGGESQRINLSTSLGSSLVGSLYILDEPSIGLHPRDTQKLIRVLDRLKQIGNTVVVVEHEEEIIRAADYIVDVGPDAGRHGGEIVYQGPAKDIVNSERSYTGKYLKGKLSISAPTSRRKWKDYIEIAGARQNNLKDITVKFPLGVMTVVTGVSGSGKSTLVRDILYKALLRHFEESTESPGAFKSLKGDLKMIDSVEFVDQNPIGKSTRSNAATYLKAYDDIRALFASQQAAKQMGFTSAYFSFNTEGGRCEECKGDGYITVEMQFMADITIPCECCHGQRFKRDILEIEYRGKNINDVLNMTVNQAIDFFSEEQGSIEKKIVRKLKPLQDVGLGYIKLGQASSTLSGGENQRVKLAYYLSQDTGSHKFFIFDEPTTGLHIHDISTLLKSFNQLISKGHTVLIIEHNLDVIRTADHVIDMGPEGGDEGGYVVATGTPEDIMKCESSYTGKALKDRAK